MLFGEEWPGFLSISDIAVEPDTWAKLEICNGYRLAVVTFPMLGHIWAVCLILRQLSAVDDLKGHCVDYHRPLAFSTVQGFSHGTVQGFCNGIFACTIR